MSHAIKSWKRRRPGCDRVAERRASLILCSMKHRRQWRHGLKDSEGSCLITAFTRSFAHIITNKRLRCTSHTVLRVHCTLSALAVHQLMNGILQNSLRADSHLVKSSTREFIPHLVGKKKPGRTNMYSMVGTFIMPVHAPEMKKKDVVCLMCFQNVSCIFWWTLELLKFWIPGGSLSCPLFKEMG